MSARVRYSRADVIGRILREVERAGSFRKLAEKWGVSHAFLHDVVNGRRRPTDTITKRIGLRRVLHRTVEEWYESDRAGRLRAGEGSE